MAVETPVATGNASAEETTRGGMYYRPNVDIYELPDELVVEADMPGASAESIDIDFEDGTLTINARVADRRPADSQYVRQEYGVGDYYRTFRVSEHIDSSKISAEYHDGVLVLRLPKTEAVKPRKIQVKA